MKRTIVIAAASAALVAGGWMGLEHQPEGMQDGAPDMAQIMEMVQKSGELGEHHKLLAKMEGEWEMTARFMMEPDSPPEISKGTSRNKLILGGRQLLSEVDLNMVFMGQEMPFSGLGLMGYDNVNGVFQSTWADSMGTGQMHQSGTLEDGKIVVEGKGKNVMGEFTMKNVIRFVDGGYDMEFWESNPMMGDDELHNTGVIEYRK